MERLTNYVNGATLIPTTTVYSEVIEPATGEAYLEAPVSNEHDVDVALQAASQAFTTWRRSTPGGRSLALFRIADALEAYKDKVVEAECRNTGKPRQVMRDVEFNGLLDHVRFYAAAARGSRGLATGSYASGTDSTMRREPVGVCAGVSPWNYPLNMAIWKIGPALAAGNTIVLKPSDTTPVTCLLAAEIIGDLLPSGVLNVVLGDRDTGRALVSHPVPRKVSITGSTRAGVEVSTAAAADLKVTSLELGGKAPVLVFADCDIEDAAAQIAEAAFFNAGQDCEAATRVLVAADIHDRFVDALVVQAGDTTYGPPNEEPNIGPLNSAAHLAKVEGYVERLPLHARVLVGGNADQRDGGYYFQPTVVTGLRFDDEIVQEEVFGPVVTVESFETEEEALRLANGVRYGLAAGLWTKDHNRVTRVSDRLEFGKVWVNCHLAVVPDMPNGGYDQSGHGNDLSVLAVEEYTRVKHVMSAVSEEESS